MKTIVMTLTCILALSSCSSGGGGSSLDALDLAASGLTIGGALPTTPSGSSVSVTVDDVAATISGSSWSHAVDPGTHTVCFYVDGDLEASKDITVTLSE